MPGDNDEFRLMTDVRLFSPFYKCLKFSWAFSLVGRVIAGHTQSHGSSQTERGGAHV